jgi:hypothetical protein
MLVSISLKWYNCKTASLSFKDGFAGTTIFKVIAIPT